MSLIVPTILVHNLADYEAELASFSSFAPRLQLDCSDESFSGHPTLALSKIPDFPRDNHPSAASASDLSDPSDPSDPSDASARIPTPLIDLHLISAHPSSYLEDILRLSPHLVIAHAEAKEELSAFFDQIRAAHIQTGLALLPASSPADFAELIRSVDHVLIFAGQLGAQGGQADLSQLAKVPRVRNINPTAEISWDGGANLDNVATLSKAGIDLINVGSAIAQSPDPALAYQTLTHQLTN